jgi:hypothetical protein
MADSPPSTEAPLDDIAQQALKLHAVAGEILNTLAPLSPGKRLRTMAAVMCMQSNELSRRVVELFQSGQYELDASD